MYNILICDDDRLYAEYISSLLKKCQRKKNKINIEICESGNECVSVLNSDKKYDWIIIDLQLGLMDGYEIASEYRKVSPDGLLYLCSGVYSPTVRSFYSRPYRFIEKGMDENILIEYLKDGIKYLSKIKKDEYIIGHIRNNRYKVPAVSIMYIENHKRGSVICIDRSKFQYGEVEDIVIYKKLEDLYNDLQGNFEYISMRCLVNIRYVKMIEGNNVVLENGIQLPVSRTMIKGFKKKFMEYWRNKL